MIIPGTLGNRPHAAWPLSAAFPPMGALATAPGTARALVRAVLASWRLGDLADACELVVSEMVANAVAASGAPAGTLLHAGGRMPVVRVFLMSDRSRLLAEVCDQGTGVPVMKDADPETAESGRGLQLIDALTAGRWGWHPAGQDAKCVWAEISQRPAD